VQEFMHRWRRGAEIVRKNFSCFVETLSTFRFQQECLNTLSTYTWINHHYLTHLLVFSATECTKSMRNLNFYGRPFVY
jgi:hypothetical protein